MLLEFLSALFFELGLFNEIGFFDEKIFLYYEENDFYERCLNKKKPIDESKIVQSINEIIDPLLNVYNSLFHTKLYTSLFDNEEAVHPQLV